MGSGKSESLVASAGARANAAAGQSPGEGQPALPLGNTFLLLKI